MPRLIDADELLLRFIPRGGENNFTRFVRETVRLRLAEMPTVDAEPVRHGHWIFNPKDAIEMMFTLPKCSECGAESPNGGNYCPNCGAKMDEVEKDADK